MDTDELRYEHYRTMRLYGIARGAEIYQAASPARELPAKAGLGETGRAYHRHSREGGNPFSPRV